MISQPQLHSALQLLRQQPLYETWQRSSRGVVLEHDGVIVYANHSYASAFGFSAPGQIVGREISDLIAPEDRDRMSAYSLQRMGGWRAPRRYSYLGNCADGTALPAEIRVDTWDVTSTRFIKSTILRMFDAPPPRGMSRDEFVVLYDIYYSSVHSLVLRILGDEEEAADCAQDTFLKAWQLLDRFDARRGAGTAWILTMARNAALDHLRARKRRTEVTAMDPFTARVTAPDELAPDRSRVKRLIQGLPHSQRRVLELAYFEDLSQSQIALRLNEPLGTVKSRSLLGVKKLKRSLTQPPGRGGASARQNDS